MIVTFPRFGHSAEMVSLMFEELGIPCIIPPHNDYDVLKKGSQISPEEICLPFKYMAGGLMQSYSQGADTVVMVATCGPCRLGEYGQLLKEVLDNAGYNYSWVIIDSPAVIGTKEFIRRIGAVAEEKRPAKHKIVKAAFNTVKLIKALDSLEKRIKRINGYVGAHSSCIRIMNELDDKIASLKSFDEGFELIRATKRRIRKLELDRTVNPIKILIVGEIYTSIEKEANRKLEDKLMMLGCSVNRHMTISWWIDNAVKCAALPAFVKNITMMTKRAFPCGIGGYAKETVNKIQKASEFDGVIKIMPSGCMPEIVTKAYCENTVNNKLPAVLNLVYDEMDGEAGYETRIEAFVDMLERRKHVLAGN